MSHFDVSIRITEGDTLVVDGEAYTIESVNDGGDQVQISAPGALADLIQTDSDFEEALADAEQIDLYR